MGSRIRHHRRRAALARWDGATAPLSATKSRSDAGSAPVEFVLVGGLVTLLTLSVLQLGIALHVRNTALDAASEGARFAALADNGLERGRQRTAELLSAALGPEYAGQVSARYGNAFGAPAAIITVAAPLPVVGLVGVPGAMEVTARAAVESPR